MSLAQIGENSVCLVVNNNRYAIRELEIPSDAIRTVKIDSYQLVQSWKNYCLTIKNIKADPSTTIKNLFVMEISSGGQLFTIHYYLEAIALGLEIDKKLKALAVINLG